MKRALKKKLVQCSTCPRKVWRLVARSRICCPACVIERQKKYDRARDPEEKKAAAKDWYEQNRAKIIARAVQWRLDNIERARSNDRRSHRNRRIAWNQLSAEVESYACDCGAPHTPERRQKILRLCSDLSVSEIREAYPCLWPCERTLYRDRALLGKQAEVAA